MTTEHFKDAPPEPYTETDEIVANPQQKKFWHSPKFQIAVIGVLGIIGFSWLVLDGDDQPQSQQFTIQQNTSSTAQKPLQQQPQQQQEPQQPAIPQTTDTDISLADQVSAALNAQRTYSEKNREGLGALANRFDTAEQRISALQEQLKRLEKQNTVTPVAPAAAEKATSKKHKKPVSAAAHAIASAHIENIYPGLAWVTYQHSTWALRPGDTFAGTTILRIDEKQRLVITTDGNIR